VNEVRPRERVGLLFEPRAERLHVGLRAELAQGPRGDLAKLHVRVGQACADGVERGRVPAPGQRRRGHQLEARVVVLRERRAQLLAVADLGHLEQALGRVRVPVRAGLVEDLEEDRELRPVAGADRLARQAAPLLVVALGALRERVEHLLATTRERERFGRVHRGPELVRGQPGAENLLALLAECRVEWRRRGRVCCGRRGERDRDQCE
jgi:hypothetical protein